MNIFHLGIYGILLKNGSILLVRKSRGPYLGLLDLPGGSPNHGEAIAHTLHREIAEETGVIVQASSLFDNMSSSVSYDEGDTKRSMHHTGLIYLIDDYDDSNIKVNVFKEDVQGADWYPINKKENDLSPFASQVVAILKGNPLLW